MKDRMYSTNPGWLVVLIWLIGVLLCLAFYAAVIIVAVHFIVKWW